MFKTQFFIRDIHYKLFIEEFIISSLIAILGIRTFLKITRYPQLGGEGFHISHMLWGGLLMFVALMLLITLLSNETKRLAAIIGGLGFGTFIDELGKFITSDNNYFYQPTFSLIYIFFVLVYLFFQFIENRREFTKKEYLVNSIELMKDAVINDLDNNEKDRAMEYLKKAQSQGKIAQTLHELYQKIDTIKPPPQNIFTRSRLYFKQRYLDIISIPWFKNIVITFFLLQGVLSVVIALLLVLKFKTYILPALLLPHSFSTTSFNIVHFASTVLATILILIGISRMYTSRLNAYIMFKRSTLVSILLTQVFAFYYSPVRAFTTLAFNVIILITLNYMITAETNLSKKN